MFVVTGFTPFCGIKSNPSQEIVRLLKHPQIYKKVILDVSIKSVEKNLRTLCSEKSKFVLHIGLDPGGSNFKLEEGAINTKSFSCPDNEGEEPFDSPINPRKGKDTFLTTILDLEKVVRKLKGFPVVISKYGGTFVSNYTYYRCLEFCKRCLYVHVPPTSEIPLLRQVKFIAKLLDALGDQLSPPLPSAGTAGTVDSVEVIERFIGAKEKLPDLRSLLRDLR
jgi:pyroglutamyl-peptidase